MKFDNKYELEHHVSLHHDKSYDCYFCSRSYLKQSELNEHLDERHSNDNKKVTHGILCRLDSEGKSESIYKETETVRYSSKELIQKSASRMGQRSTLVPYERKTENLEIDPYQRRIEDYVKYGCDYEVFVSKPQPYTLSSCKNIEKLQVPIDFYYNKPSSPIMFYKEEDNRHVLGSIVSRSMSPVTTLDAFNMFLTESHEHITNCYEGSEEPIAKRLRPDSTINCIPSFEELFPQNHIYYDHIRGVSSRWS